MDAYLPPCRKKANRGGTFVQHPQLPPPLQNFDSIQKIATTKFEDWLNILRACSNWEANKQTLETYQRLVFAFELMDWSSTSTASAVSRLVPRPSHHVDEPESSTTTSSVPMVT